MAIPAIDSIIAHMVFVAELHRLRSCHILPREIRRARQPQHGSQRKSGQEYCRKQTKPGDKIRAAVKNLGHVCVALWRISMKGAGTGETTSVTESALSRVRYDAIVSYNSFRIATLPRNIISSIFFHPTYIPSVHFDMDEFSGSRDATV